jgi:hypothetical protein
MSRIGRAAARVVIGLYPRAWRHRYAAEMRDLVDDTDAGIGDVVNLAAGAARQHAIGGAPMRYEPAHRHPSAFAIGALAVLAPTLAFVTLSLIGHELGVTPVASAVDPLIETVTAPPILDLALVLGPLVAAALAALPVVDLRSERGAEGRMLAMRLRVLPMNLAVVALAVLVGGALVAHMIAESALHAAR